jgi:hypothetical protein
MPKFSLNVILVKGKFMQYYIFVSDPTISYQPVVNFINVKHTNFLYERRILAAFSSYMYVEKPRLYKKFVRKMLMKLTP